MQEERTDELNTQSNLNKVENFIQRIDHKKRENMNQKIESLYKGANYSNYIPEDTLKLNEATALSLGMNPEVATWDFMESFKREKELKSIVETFQKRYEKIKEAYSRAVFCDVETYESTAHAGLSIPIGGIEIPLKEFYIWGRKKNYEFSPDFIKHIDPQIHIPNYEELYKEKCQEGENLKSNEEVKEIRYDITQKNEKTQPLPSRRW